MKSQLLILFVLSISLIGVNEVFASHPTNNDSLGTVRLYYSDVSKEFNIGLNYPFSQVCAVGFGAYPDNSPEKFTANDSYLPNIFQFGQGFIGTITDKNGIVHRAQQVECVNSVVSFPISLLNDQETFHFEGIIQGGVWDYNLNQPVTLSEHTFTFTYLKNILDLDPQWCPTGDYNLVSDGNTSLFFAGFHPSHCEPVALPKIIQNSNDDAIELILSGAVDADYDLIELSENNISGIRFNDIQLDSTQIIKRAYIEVIADNDETKKLSVAIFGELDINSKEFIETNSNISNRQKTTNSILWNLPDWKSNVRDSTPDLTKIINEIVNQSGWTSGNSMTFLFEGIPLNLNGNREFYSFDYHDSKDHVRLIIEIDTSDKKNGGGCNDCTPPWLGFDNNGVLKVENGVTINGISKNAGLYHTEYPMIKTNIGDENTIILKYRENNGPANIKMIELASVKEIGSSFGESQWSIEVWLNYFANDMFNPTIKEIKVFDKDNLLGEVSGRVYLDQCKSDSLDPYGCLSASITFTNEKVPDSPVLVSQAIDYNNNSFQNFFNDGLLVIDPNYVEPVTPKPYKYECKDPELDTIMNGGDRKNCNWRVLNMPHLWKN